VALLGVAAAMAVADAATLPLSPAKLGFLDEILVRDVVYEVLCDLVHETSGCVREDLDATSSSGPSTADFAAALAGRDFQLALDSALDLATGVAKFVAQAPRTIDVEDERTAEQDEFVAQAPRTIDVEDERTAELSPRTAGPTTWGASRTARSRRSAQEDAQAIAAGIIQKKWKADANAANRAIVVTAASSALAEPHKGGEGDGPRAGNNGEPTQGEGGEREPKRLRLTAT